MHYIRTKPGWCKYEPRVAIKSYISAFDSTLEILIARSFIDVPWTSSYWELSVYQAEFTVSDYRVYHWGRVSFYILSVWRHSKVKDWNTKILLLTQDITGYNQNSSSTLLISQRLERYQFFEREINHPKCI